MACACQINQQCKSHSLTCPLFRSSAQSADPSILSAKHFDEGKLPFQHILGMPLIEEMAKVGAYGHKKYGDYYNYKKGMPWMSLLGSCTRHLRSFICGENNDKESGLSHLAHLAYDAGMLFDLLSLHPDLDDRPNTHS